MTEEKAWLSEQEQQEVLALVSTTYGYDFSDYAEASISRRISRFMSIAGVKTAYDLKYFLVNDKNAFDLFLQEITVNVSEMFRDPSFFKCLKEQVFPVLATYPIIKIWHAGCATGEEAFSTAMLLHEAGLLQRSRLYATDINPGNIEKARNAVLPLNVLEAYKANYLTAGGERDFDWYFSKTADGAALDKDLTQNILFSQHNLVTDQVFNEFQLICCRNVMIYFNRQLQARVNAIFYDSLCTFGYLAIGLKETMQPSPLKENFETVSNADRIFRKIK